MKTTDTLNTRSFQKFLLKQMACSFVNFFYFLHILNTRCLDVFTLLWLNPCDLRQRSTTSN